jgi:hypothetical protein
MANAFTTEAFTLLGVGVGIVALRLVARTKLVGLRGLQLDDYLMCFATVRLAIRVHILCRPIVHSTLPLTCLPPSDTPRSSTHWKPQLPTP